jgi:hypothetical protein
MSIIALMMAVSIYETSVNFYQTTRRNNPEVSHLHARRRENLKSHKCCTLAVYYRAGVLSYHCNRKDPSNPFQVSMVVLSGTVPQNNKANNVIHFQNLCLKR